MCGREFARSSGLSNHYNQSKCGYPAGSDYKECLEIERLMGLVMTRKLAQKRVEVWWPSDDAWFAGKVTKCVVSRAAFEIMYDDGEKHTEKVTKHSFVRVLDGSLDDNSSSSSSSTSESDDSGDESAYANATIRVGGQYQCVDIPELMQLAHINPMDQGSAAAAVHPTRVAVEFEDLRPDRRYVKDATQATYRAKKRAREMQTEDSSKFPQFGAATAKGIRYAMNPVHSGGYKACVLEGKVDNQILKVIDPAYDSVKEKVQISELDEDLDGNHPALNHGCAQPDYAAFAKAAQKKWTILGPCMNTNNPHHNLIFRDAFERLLVASDGGVTKTEGDEGDDDENRADCGFALQFGNDDEFYTASKVVGDKDINDDDKVRNDFFVDADRSCNALAL